MAPPIFKRMRRIVFQLHLALFTSICCSTANLGCHVSGTDEATDSSPRVSGDVAKSAALARADTTRAYDLMRGGNFAEAEKLLNRAVTADPTYGPARNDLGMIYFERNELYNAAWQFENASKLMPGEAPPQNNLGLVLEESAKFAEAQKAYERACQLDPDNSEYAGNLARLRIRLGLRDDATNRLLESIVQRDPRPDWVAWARFNLIRAQSSKPPPPTEGGP